MAPLFIAHRATGPAHSLSALTESAVNKPLTICEGAQPAAHWHTMRSSDARVHHGPCRLCEDAGDAQAPARGATARSHEPVACGSTITVVLRTRRDAPRVRQSAGRAVHVPCGESAADDVLCEKAPRIQAPGTPGSARRRTCTSRGGAWIRPRPAQLQPGRGAHHRRSRPPASCWSPWRGLGALHFP